MPRQGIATIGIHDIAVAAAETSEHYPRVIKHPRGFNVALGVLELHRKHGDDTFTIQEALNTTERWLSEGPVTPRG